MTVREAIRYGSEQLKGFSSASRDAELLLLHTLGKDRVWLLTHPEATLDSAQLAAYADRIARRARHEPMQYIVGEQEFFGLAFSVTPAVLIPRPETEHLVEATLERLPHDRAVRISDVGTGSGAIAVSLAHKLPQAWIAALDISPAALEVARGNAVRHAVNDRLDFHESDLLAAVSSETYDAVVSNPPYVPASEELEAQVRDYEPHTALFAGPSGLDIYRRLIPAARDVLKPGGWLLLEIGHGQREAIAGLLEGWSGIEFVDDLQGIPRVAIARRD